MKYTGHAGKGVKINPDGKYGLCSKELFRLILERERSRSDRNNHLLTMILFDVGDDEQSKSIMNLISILKKRLRGIDKYGWFDYSLIGVLLPNTTFKGGAILAREVCEKVISLKCQPPSHKIYTYPISWLKSELKEAKKVEVSHKAKNPKYIEGVDSIFAKNIQVWKSVLDHITASVLLCIFSPIFLIIPIIIKLVSPGPVFLKQDRVGHGGKIFTFYKFRTMKAHSDVVLHKTYLNELIKSDQPMTKLDSRDDPRIIPFGKVLRKSCMDELPQLINVIKGDMSLVGPRPCMPYEAYEYLKWHQYRFDIRPGMTGLWQVSGKNRLSFKEMIRCDIIYAKNMSFWLDLWILIKTMPTIVSIIVDKIKIDSFFSNVEKNRVAETQFKEFIRRYYSDVYNVDKLEFIDDKLKNYHIDLMDLMLLLTKLHKLTPTYNVAKRYFGICKLIDTEKRAQLGSN